MVAGVDFDQPDCGDCHPALMRLVHRLILIKPPSEFCGQNISWQLPLIAHTHYEIQDTSLYKFLEETAADCMTRSVNTVTRDVTMRALLSLFERDDFDAYPVVEGAHVVGLVTKLDFLRCFAFTPTQLVPHYDELMSKVVSDVMNSTFIYVGAATKLTRVLQLMVEHRVRSIPVIDAEKLIGVVSREDIMRSLRRCTGADD